MSLATDLATRLRSRLDAGEWAAGERLPPVRELAVAEHVSVAVAGQAYALLGREGRIVARVGRGSYVARRRSGDDALVDLGPNRRPPAVSATLDLQERLAGARRSGSINLSAGVPEVDAEVAAAVATELEAVVREDGASLLGYGPPRGDPGLRRVVAATWARRGLTVDEDALLVTTSGQQAIDLAVRALVEPGDVVLCETPTYAGAIDSLMASRARIVPVPTDGEGLRVDRVEEALGQERVRLLFVNPTGNNATGVVLSDERRRALADLSARAGLVILEDDTGAELIHDGPVPAPVAAFEPEAPVLLVKSFAKTVVPGLRLGVIHAPAAFDRRILAAKLVADRYTSPPLARALARYLERPEAASHLERQRRAYGARRDAFLRSLERRLGGRATWVEPRAGFNLWLRLPERVSEEEIFSRALERGVIVSPGHVYVPPGVATNHLRLSFSTASAAEADRGVARLAAALGDATRGSRRRSFEADVAVV
ncbi:MAG: Transcriptional regulator, GntR family domain / Aspartate aminotransferase [uncultured Thermoleophilia bacterium]|uniref:Transcriptional regulator, GntR family domain / Aspartate aminotransferase n=1 Tax=uncultured Thermoleophilia bacterium TaxID=1497501 RepID=A0A6J4UHP4_9ACTN|nr:MAG: Transcriptional regulator, GntR family domain / Aspartate aminotransferase [uncultured Thermoleophilia bacterium]